MVNYYKVFGITTLLFIMTTTYLHIRHDLLVKVPQGRAILLCSPLHCQNKHKLHTKTQKTIKHFSHRAMPYMRHSHNTATVAFLFE